jgi:serine phosphatase RsbU (regulator of sigma subunit)
MRRLGAAVNVTALREGEARAIRVLEAMPAAFISMDRDWRITYVNAEAERVLTMPRQQLLGGELWTLFPGAVGTEFDEMFRYAVRTQEPASLEAYYPAPLRAWYEVRIWPDEEGLSLYFLDISARRAAQAQAESAASRAALLAEITSTLNGTLDADEVAARLARLMVPALADWCVVSLVDDGGEGSDSNKVARLRDIGWWHPDPAQRPAVARYAQHRLAFLTEDSFLAQVLRTGEPALVRNDATATLGALFGPGVARDALYELAPGSVAVLALRAHGRTLGLVTLFAAAGSDRPTDLDLATAGEAAERAGLALDNARLYAQQRDLAEGLQRSLLTPPPQPDHLEIVVRYQPAAEQAQVGGDWYDAFMVADGTTTLVIGDVIGHDTAAAAAMGQVRGVLRGVAHSVDDSPAGVLSALDRAMFDLDVGSLATAVLAKIEQTVEDAARGVRVLRWSNAGHPPPLLIDTAGEGGAGTATLLAGIPDLLLGLDARTARTDHEQVLRPGATVLLFTDGLVERRGASLDDGLEWLRTTAASLGGLPLEELCDALLEGVAERLEDDVALLAVRAHPEGRPRPAEAGPERLPHAPGGVA